MLNDISQGRYSQPGEGTQGRLQTYWKDYDSYLTLQNITIPSVGEEIAALAKTGRRK